MRSTGSWGRSGLIVGGGRRGGGLGGGMGGVIRGVVGWWEGRGEGGVVLGGNV